MSSWRDSSVGRIVKFPGQGKAAGPADLLKVVLPVAVALAWQLYTRRSQGGKQAKESVAAASKATAKTTRKVRHSSRYYVLTVLIAALENAATRKVLISALKVIRSVV